MNISTTILIHVIIATIVLFLWWLVLVLTQAWNRRKDPGQNLARLLVQWQEEDAEYRRMHALATRYVHERMMRWTEEVNQRTAEIHRRVHETYRRYSQDWNTTWAIQNRQDDYWYTSVRLFLNEPLVPMPQPRREMEEKVDWVHEGF